MTSYPVVPKITKRASLVAALLVIFISVVAIQGRAGAASAPSLLAPRITVNPTSYPQDGNDISEGFQSEASGQKLSIQWLQLAPGSITWTKVPGAHRSSYLVHDPETHSGYQYKARFTNPAGSATSRPATLMDVSTTSVWSGYVDTGALYGSVSATWTVPTIVCPAPFPSPTSTDSLNAPVYGAMVQWIGIGGWTGSPLKQVGVLAQCQNGQANYVPWWMVFRGTPIAGANLTKPVYAGDAIHAAVTNDGSGQWTFVLNDLTQGWEFSDTNSADAVCSAGGYCTATSTDPWAGGDSADFIVEHQTAWDMGPLPDFGSVRFTAASIEANGVTEAMGSSDPTMVMNTDQGGYNMTAPGTIQHGSAFTILWKRGN